MPNEYQPTNQQLFNPVISGLGSTLAGRTLLIVADKNKSWSQYIDVMVDLINDADKGVQVSNDMTGLSYGSKLEQLVGIATILNLN